MTEEQRQKLRSIKTFAQLIKYLRDELDWPVEQVDDPDDLTFDWSNDLGLKDSERVGIKEIKQLRPLESGQPWGIFFVNFEKKRLPIVILRRILNALVTKKRASANNAQRAAWQQHDLLFISRYGDDDDRQLTFAHFSEPRSKLTDTKATLRVLGWDDEDTNLKLDHVADTLHSKLSWPKDTADFKTWREQWSQAFELRPRQVIATAEDLAQRLAELAKRIRNRMLLVLPKESEKGDLQKLLKGFKTALIHDLDETQFADMYAQTITYGLFSARVSRHEPGAPGAVAQDDILAMVPVTNPFLREMLAEFLKAGGRRGKLDFDELGIQEVVDLLRDPQTHLDAVLRDFGKRTRGEDPVIHFYETFLRAYDNRLKVQRGVFYTPQPVVSYIVRSVHGLLQTEFGLADGLADTTTWGEMLKKHPGLSLPPLTDEPGEKRTISPDEPFVQILDPATGTATFLVEVIEVIYRTLAAKWKEQRLTEVQQRAAWNDYVPQHLLPRLHAFELMMAPYAIAHMKIGLKLAETGYRFGADERARIYLTNALEAWVKQLPLIGFGALAHEAAAVNEIKRYKRFTVVIGNPPYAQYSMNLNAAARAHIDRFRYANGEKIRTRNALQLERNLNDDYVKFLGYSSALFPAGTGVLGMITNRMFLDSESLVGLREWFATNFEQLHVVDLWGSSEESRRVERLSTDENVFDILQGVAISFYIGKRRRASAAKPAAAREVLGSREEKYRLLASDLDVGRGGWEAIHPTPPNWWLHRNASGSSGTGREWLLPEIFPQFSTLVASNRDHLVVDVDKEVVVRNVKAVQAFRGSNQSWSEHFGITLKTGWNVNAARERLSAIPDIAAFVKPIEYRAFDRRWIFYHPTLVWQTAPVSSNNVLRSPKNRILISLGKNRAETTNGHWVSATLADKSVVSTRDNASGFPLYLFDEQGELGLSGTSGRPNLAPDFLRYLSAHLKLPQEGEFGLPRGLTPEDILHYTYAVLHSRSYRSRYAELLKSDFPRLPLTQNLELFRALARLGEDLISVHLLESPRLARHGTEFIGDRALEIERISWAGDTVWMNKAQTAGFRGVREEVWTFHIGDYQVCEKWLKDRKGRSLSKDDVSHYQKVIAGLSQTIRLMAEIEHAIERYGGWPGAFQAAAPAQS